MIVKKNGTVIGNSGKEIGTKDSRGYVLIRLGKHEPTIKRCVLVAKEYLNWFEGCEVHHKNKIKWDDRVENLEVLTPFQHRIRHNKIKIIGRINNGTIDRVYNSIMDAKRDNGMSLNTNDNGISKVLAGKMQKTYGYGWIDLEYPKIILNLAVGNTESVTEEEKFQAFALIYKALLNRVRDPEGAQKQANLSRNDLEQIFKGFHFN